MLVDAQWCLCFQSVVANCPLQSTNSKEQGMSHLLDFSHYTAVRTRLHLVELCISSRYTV